MRNVRRLVALALVAAVSVTAVIVPARVEIEVDGEVVRVRSYADTVDEVLESAGVRVGSADRVTPATHADVSDGLDIEVQRAVPVLLSFEGREAMIPVAGETVRDVLVAAGIGDVRGLSVTPPPSTPLEQVDRVEVATPVTARVRVDGRTHVVHLTTGTVGDALALAGIRLTRRDTVRPPRDVVIDGDDVRITVTRRERQTVTREVRLPFHEQVVETDDLYVDQQEVVREGSEGVRRDTYRVTRVNGEVTRRRLVSQEVVVEPVDRVVHVGTAPRPEPEPEPVPEPEPSPAPEADASDDDVWYRLAECESGGNWSMNGTYDGGLQFHPDTWTRWKPDGYPAYAYQATPEQQITVGKRLHAARGWSPWPYCADKLGLQ